MFPPFCNLCFCWQSLRVPTYIRLCVLFCLFVTENHETSTTLCGTVQIFASAVHMYAGWIANIANYWRVSWFFSALIVCVSPQCFQCSTKGKISCREPGIAHVISCNKGSENGSAAIYHGGESSLQSEFERDKLHLEQFWAWLSSHCILIHNKVHHNCDRKHAFHLCSDKHTDGQKNRRGDGEWRIDLIPRAGF